VRAVLAVAMLPDGSPEVARALLEEALPRLADDAKHKVVVESLRILSRFVPTGDAAFRDGFCARLVAAVCRRVEREAGGGAKSGAQKSGAQKSGGAGQEGAARWRAEQLEEVAVALLNTCQALTSAGLGDDGWARLGPSLGVLLRTGRELLDPIYIDMLRMMLPPGLNVSEAGGDPGGGGATRP
jgi:hypothetical protein